MVIFWCQAAMATLDIQPINEKNGYVEINTLSTEIVTTSHFIVHTIDPNEILALINNMTFNTNNLSKSHRDLILNELTILKTKAKTLMPKPVTRKNKRALMNVVGSAYKYLFGTMDDNDRQDIENHLKIVDENLHNSITTLNQQVKVNEYFSKTFKYLKDAVEQDRQAILNYQTVAEKKLRDALSVNLFSEQILKVHILKEKIDHIQDSIVSAKHGLLHPGILTNEEVDIYNIDLYKLQHLKICAIEFAEKLLLLVIKIPQEFAKIQLRYIHPVSNGQMREIDSKSETVFTYQNRTYTYEKSKTINELQLSKHCIFSKSCKLISNKMTEIIEIDDETLLLKNFKETNLIQDCDKREIILNGNYLLHYQNCTLKILKQSFSNVRHYFEQRFYFPVKENLNFPYKPSFEEIVIGHIENTKEINELKYHKKITYTFSTTIVILLVIAIIIIMVFLKKQNKLKVKIVNKTQECFESRRGGVTSQVTSADNVPTALSEPIETDGVKVVW